MTTALFMPASLPGHNPTRRICECRCIDNHPVGKPGTNNLVCRIDLEAGEVAVCIQCAAATRIAEMDSEKRRIVCSYCGDPDGVNPDGSYRRHNCS